MLLAVAALCRDAGRLPQALASIEDPSRIARLAVESPSSRVRQLAAESIADPAQLRQLLKQVRGKDKNVYKIIKQKCDALNAEQRKSAQLQSDLSALCTSLERHSERPYDPQYPAAFEQLLGRWHALGGWPDVHLEQRGNQAIDRCRDVIAAQARLAAQQAEQQAVEHAAQQAAREARERAQQAAHEATAAQADAQTRLREQEAAAREAEQAARAQLRAAEEQLHRQIGGLIRLANDALRDGNTQKAAGLRRAIEEKWPAATAVPGYLTRQVQQLDDKLNELKQWKDYAVAPKRIELIAEMESLVGSTEEPKMLSERIKSLQQEWRTISKGIVSDAAADWERFQRASHAAYLPCQAYFEAQAQRRGENLQHRKAVLERLTAFEATHTGEGSDWRLLARVVREAPQEWRQYFPVDREANRALQGEFDETMRRLQSRLDAWYERNVADKQSLVKRARHLLAQQDSREAIEAVKSLQILWKETGVAPRDQDQALWSEFREVCDAVYQKREQAHMEYTAALEATKVNAVALCEQAERAAELSGTALREAGVQMAEWRAAFDALDEMPRADARGLHERFERALGLYEAALARQRLRDAEQSVADLFAADRHVQAYAWAAAEGAEPAEREALKQAADRFIAGVQHWPKGGLQALKEALASAGSPSHGAREDREKALRRLCIRCKMYSETPTPAEDEALRREYQVQRLMQGMGQGSHALDADWDAMVLEWIRIGAVSPAVHESLQRRFMNGLARRPPPSPQRPAFRSYEESSDRKGHENRAGSVRRHGRDGSTRATAR